MKRRGGAAFLLAAICFVFFSVNVAAGARGDGAYLGDISEMLTLFAAVLFFVMGILAREADERGKKVGDLSR